MYLGRLVLALFSEGGGGGGEGPGQPVSVGGGVRFGKGGWS